ncbi:MAG: hypothetical protein ABI967_12785 [bacterium]
MSNPKFSRVGKIAIAVGVCASLAFFTLAIVIFIQVRDWSAHYISMGCVILAATFIAARRRSWLRE